jgi:hypothetical protein
VDEIYDANILIAAQAAFEVQLQVSGQVEVVDAKLEAALAEITKDGCASVDTATIVTLESLARVLPVARRRRRLVVVEQQCAVVLQHAGVGIAIGILVQASLRSSEECHQHGEEEQSWQKVKRQLGVSSPFARSIRKEAVKAQEGLSKRSDPSLMI